MTLLTPFAPYLWPIVILAVLLVIFFYVRADIRPIVKALVDDLAAHAVKYAAGYIRGGLYGLVAFLTAFISEFKPMGHAQLLAMDWMAWCVAWAGVLLPTAVTMRAFFDGTMERISSAPEPGETEKSATITTTINPPISPPVATVPVPNPPT
jgi:hypothetical protein